MSCDAETRQLLRKYSGEVKGREVPREAMAGTSWMMAVGVLWPWDGETHMLEGAVLPRLKEEGKLSRAQVS